MPRIKILSEILSNKIAAGEVVERPASVVKELVENAIDAKSTQITVEVEKGGRSIVRVSDNGVGMDHDDGLLAIQRYATSKVYNEDDLFSISTLGFRGEALPSIASVSKMDIVTKTEQSYAGTRIIIHGGQVKEVSDVGAAQGTVVTVSDLFFNTPARRKHLKTQQTEIGHITDTVSRIAIAWPGIHFRLSHNNKSLADWGATSTPAYRITDVLKGRLEESLHELDYKRGDVRIRGLIASPEITRSTSRGEYVYVNGRFVRDKVLYHAIIQGYAGSIMKGKFPVVVIFVTLPLDQLDVNVHPTKSSVRFESPRLVHDTVSKAIGEKIRSLNQPTWGNLPVLKAYRQPQQYAIPPTYPRAGEPASIFPKRLQPPVPDTPAPLWEEKTFGSLTIIGQLKNSYILCESREGLILIDQHAAHERVVFESLKADYARSKIVTQGLLVPERLELGYREAGILESVQKDLLDMGVEIEHFGGNTYLVRSVPQILAAKAIGPLIVEIVEKMAELGVPSGVHQVVDECLILMACHGAIRAGKKMSSEEMKALLDQLDTLEDAMHCPHGRPTIIRKSFYEIEKAFKRIA